MSYFFREQPILLSAADVVRRGTTGKATRILQSLLCARGRWVTVDGICGPKTEQAIRDYQGSVSLAVDGIAGRATWPRLIHG